MKTKSKNPGDLIAVLFVFAIAFAFCTPSVFAQDYLDPPDQFATQQARDAWQRQAVQQTDLRPVPNGSGAAELPPYNWQDSGTPDNTRPIGNQLESSSNAAWQPNGRQQQNGRLQNQPRPGENYFNRPEPIPGILSGYRQEIEQQSDPEPGIEEPVEEPISDRPTEEKPQDEALGENDLLTTSNVESLVSAINSDETIADKDAQTALAQLTNSTSSLTKAAELKNVEAKHIEATENAGQTEDSLNTRILSLESAQRPEIDTTMELDLLPPEIARQQAIVDQFKREQETNDELLSNRVSHRQEVRKQQTETAAATADLENALDKLAVEDETLLQKAARYEASARLMESQSLLDSLNAELAMLEASDERKLVQLKGRMLELSLEAAQNRLNRLVLLENEKRVAQANAAMQEAQAGVAPELKESREENANLAATSQNLIAEIESARIEANKQQQQLDRILRSSRNAVNRYNNFGLSSSIGDMLRKRKSELPDTGFLRFATDKVTERIDEVGSATFDLDEQIRGLSRDTIIQEIQSNHGLLTANKLESLREEIEQTSETREKLLGEAISNYDRLSSELEKLELADSQLVRKTDEFRTFINERILWIRSNDFLFSRLRIDESDQRLLDQRQWTQATDTLVSEFRTSPMFYILFGFVVLGLFLLRPRFCTEVDSLGVRAAKGSCDTFWPTSRALLLTILVSLALPMLPLILGLRFRTVQDASSGSLFSALGSALLATAWFVIPVEIFRRMCRKGGLAQMHFSWSDKIVATLRNNIAWGLPVGAIITFAISLLYSLQPEHKIDLIERVLFVCGMAALTIFLYRCFSPKKGMYSEYLHVNERSWATQTSMVWFGAILGIPLALAGLTIWGYFYTALNLAACVYSTFVFAIVIENLRELLQRFILVRRRHAHISKARRNAELRREKLIEQKKEQAREKELELRKQLELKQEKEKLRAELKAEPDSDNTNRDPLSAATEEIARDAVKAAEKSTEKNVAEITAATAALEAELIESMPKAAIDDDAKKAGKLISMCMLLVWLCGIWLIWSDVLPALRALDNYVIWPAGASQQLVGTDNIVDQPVDAPATVAPDAATESSTDAPAAELPVMDPATSAMAAASNQYAPTAGGARVTVRDLLIFLLIATVTFISARNFPSLLEMFFLESLPVDHSVRNAVKSLTSYLIVILGLIFAFRSLAIGWSQVQWLVTALTFGLAFGLQEIFANFVAGIILLFERPIRIGDLITVDNVTGIVSKIRTRATTIISWDRKEYIIPNKDFITGRMLNWTLSDKVNRVVIDVGVGYGSNVELAKELLYQVCANHPMIVDDPPTIVTFDKFGDNALNFRVRTFLPDIDARLPVIDSLHTAINQAFKEAGIEISFPQRDLHIRSIDKEVFRLINNSDDGPYNEAA